MLGVGVYCIQKFRMIVFLLLLVIIEKSKVFNVYVYKTKYDNVYYISLITVMCTLFL